jgi:hypothetical protein
MFLSALLLAAALQAPLPSSLRDIRAPVTVYASKDEAFEAMRKKEACRTSGLELADQSPTDAPKVKKLGDLPPANQTLTVLRSVDGCPVSSTVRYNVGR